MDSLSIHFFTGGANVFSCPLNAISASVAIIGMHLMGATASNLFMQGGQILNQ